MQPSSPAGISLEIEAEDAFSVREFTLEDGISSLFNLDVVATCPNPAVDFESIIGQRATFRLDLSAAHGEASGPRAWSGIVQEIDEIASEEQGLSTYSLTIVPQLWLLTQRTNCKIFQQITDLNIALSILSEWGIQPLVECGRGQKTRKYRVQYHESDYSFLCRVLEASGVSFLHRQEGDASKLVLVDAPESGKARGEALTHMGEPALGTVWATNLRASRRVRHGRVTYSDHDHRLPNRPLLAEAVASKNPVEAKLERYQYMPGAFRFGNPGPADTPTADDRGRTRTDPDEGKRIAEQTAAALVARSQRFSFDTNALDVAPGTVLAIAGHPRAELHKKLLVTRVSVAGAFDQEPTVSADAVSAGGPYRPEMVTPQPTVQGVEAATVVGPAGETIHCDEFGRVRVQFHWDRYGTSDQFSSCWIPVNQPWAGDAMGALNIPRIGQEVIVDFLGGNPEEPVILGRIFTHLLRTPMSLPADKTQSGFKSKSVPATGGFNELMFEDAAGRELIRMRAEKDWRTLVNNDQQTTIGNTRSTNVTSNDSETVGGNQAASVLGNLTQMVGQEAISQVLSNASSFVGGGRLMDTIGGLTSNAMTHTMTSQQATLLQVGSSTIYIGPDAVIIQSPKVLLYPGEEVLASAVMTGSVPAAAGGGGAGS
jgi:type VI secretion system secreted protein VgrG